MVKASLWSLILFCRYGDSQNRETYQSKRSVCFLKRESAHGTTTVNHFLNCLQLPPAKDKTQGWTGRHFERSCTGSILNTEGLPERGLTFKEMGAKLAYMPQATMSTLKDHM